MKISLTATIVLCSSILFLNSCSDNNEINNKIHQELSLKAESVNKYLPNRINKYIKSSKQHVKDLTYISQYQIYLTIDSNILKTSHAITHFQNDLIDGKCADKKARDLMKNYHVSYQYDFIDEFGQVQGFVLNDQECKELQIKIN